MLTKLRMELEREELEALQKVADDDVRSPADQARHWVRKALREAGKLADKTNTPDEEVHADGS